MQNSIFWTIMLVILLLVMIVIIGLLYFGLLIDIHVIKKAKVQQTKIACVGDSITYGFGVNNWFKNNYPTQLNNKLGKDYCVNNFGYSSRTLVDTCELAYTKEKLYQKSLDFKPDIVVIMLGTNDASTNNWQNRDTFYNDYVKLVKSYLNLNSTKQIILMTPIPVNGVSKEDKQREKVIINDIIPIIEQISTEMSLTYINLFDKFTKDKTYYRDALHPNKKGAELIAAEVYNILKG